MEARGTQLAHPQWKMREGFMSRFNRFLVAAFMLAAMFLPNMARAMSVRLLGYVRLCGGEGFLSLNKVIYFNDLKMDRSNIPPNVPPIRRRRA